MAQCIWTLGKCDSEVKSLRSLSVDLIWFGGRSLSEYIVDLEHLLEKGVVCELWW